jgi:hypothetical protein
MKQILINDARGETGLSFYSVYGTLRGMLQNRFNMKRRSKSMQPKM